MSVPRFGKRMNNKEISPLEVTLADFEHPQGSDLLGRTRPFLNWQQARRACHAWPYGRTLESAPRTTAQVRYDDGASGHGINFASQDYLSLSTHPAVIAAAHRAVSDFGVHSAGTPVLLGSCRMSLLLERELAEVLSMEHTVLFPSGWAAAFGAIRGLVRRYDHVLIDLHASAVLQQAAETATPNVIRYAHLEIEALTRRLAEIRAKDKRNAILVITESTFTIDGDSPRLAALQERCNVYQAALLVDVSHDLGATGPSGTGQLGVQNVLGAVDLVIGSLAKSFASNGGFLATRAREVKEYVKCHSGAHAESTALSPLQAAVILEAVRIARGREGEGLRARLEAAIITLRDELAAMDLDVRGHPSASATIAIGAEAVARQASWLAFQRGCFVNLLEHPVVGLGEAVFQMHCQAAHTPLQIFEAADLVTSAIREADSNVRSGRSAG